MTAGSIGDQELALLRFVADRGGATVGEAAEGFGDPRHLARSTVLTMMERLRRKGHLGRKAVDGVYRYQTRVSSAELLRGVVRRFVEGNLGGSLTPFVAYLSESRRGHAGRIASARGSGRTAAIPDDEGAAAMTAIDVLARGLLQTTVQGSVAVLIVWVICRAIPRLPASAKCALWWVASAKLLVSLATIEPIGVPVVPSGLLASTPAAMPSSLDPAESLRVYCGVGPCARDDAKERIVTPTPTVTTRAAGPVSRAITTGEVIMLAVVAAWLLGAVAALSWLAARTRHARRIVAEARPASDQLRSMAERLADRARTAHDTGHSHLERRPIAPGAGCVSERRCCCPQGDSTR